MARAGASRGKIPVQTYLLRGVLLIGTVALAFGSAASAVTTMMRNVNPTGALRVSPSDPGALVQEIDSALAANGEAALKSGRLVHSAQEALRGAALTPAALRFLSMDAQFRGDTKKADQLLALSERMSRREVGTQFLLIEKRVALDDVAGTLVHYDRALRTSPNARPLLFPMFNEAAADPSVATEIATMMRRTPNWLPAFIDWVLFEAPAIDHLGAVFVLIPPKDELVWTEDRKRALVGKLVSSGQTAAALQLYYNYAGGDRRAFLRDGNFQRASKYPPLDWVLDADSNFDMLIADGVAKYSAPTGTAGVVLSQLLALPPGRYRLTVNMTHDVTENVAIPRWTISCGDQAKAVAATLEIAGDGKSMLYSQDFAVAPGCTSQWLRLELRSVNAASGQNGAIQEVRVERQN